MRSMSRVVMTLLQVAAFVFVTPLALSQFAAATTQHPTSDVPSVPATDPLTVDQIVQLMDGKSFAFHNYGRPLKGTTHWDIKAHAVSGKYNYAGIFTGTFKADWMVSDGKSCTTDKYQGTVCMKIYAYGDGFMEVTPEGKVYSVSVPATTASN